MIADYDEQTDTGVSAIYKSVGVMLSEIQNSTPAASPYAGRRDAYQKLFVDIDALSLRASKLAQNTIIEQQLGLLRKGVADLEELDKKGIKSTQVNDLRSGFDVICGAILKLEIGLKRGK